MKNGEERRRAGICLVSENKIGTDTAIPVYTRRVMPCSRHNYVTVNRVVADTCLSSKGHVNTTGFHLLLPLSTSAFSSSADRPSSPHNISLLWAPRSGPAHRVPA